jgi:hypothetical protein
MVGGVTHEASGVDAAEVQRAGGLELGRLEAERVQEELLVGAATRSVFCESRVVVGGHGGVVGVDKLEIRHVAAVNLELELVSVNSDGEISPVRGGQELDGVIKVNLLDPRLGSDGTLGLGDEHVLRGPRERRTLVGVKIHIMCVAFPLFRGERGPPRDANLDVVILEGDEGDGRLPILTEGEAERVEPALGRLGETRLGLGEILGEDGRGDKLRKGGGLIVNHLTTDEQLHLGNLSEPVSGRVIESLSPVVGGEVHVAEHITLALEADRGHPVTTGVALDNLTLHGLCKVRVTLVAGTEKGNFRLPNDVSILSTYGDELSYSTGHFIVYYFYFFKLTHFGMLGHSCKYYHEGLIML